MFCLCVSPAGDSRKNSIFNVGEITRLMKFPGVARTFVVKTVAGLPSGEASWEKRRRRTRLSWLMRERCCVSSPRHFPGDVLHHRHGLPEAGAGGERLPDGVPGHRADGGWSAVNARTLFTSRRL